MRVKDERLEALKEILATKTIEDAIVLKEKYRDIKLSPDDVEAINRHLSRLQPIPKGGNPMTSEDSRKIWIRIGDVAEYESFDTPYDAGFEVRQSLPEKGLPSYFYTAAGVSIPPNFTGNNYISLFWGDKDAQWIRDLSEEEKRDFERGVTRGIQ